MAAATGRTISTLTDRPLTLVRDLEMCDDEDMSIFQKWNNVETVWEEKCVHDLFAKQVANHADGVAVDAWDGNFTYGELDRLSSNLAEHLINLGIIPETFVALCFEKSKWLVVSILAVIKAGGAYVVIEPYYPLSRMTDICTQLDINVTLASPDLLHIAKSLSDQAVVVEPGSEYFHEGQGARRQRERQSPSTPGNALYVVFSSGSTGKPKGIVVEHAEFVSWGTTLRESLCLDAQSRVLQFSSFAFLIAHRDVLLTLMFGGCVCMPSESQRLNHLETFISEYRVNWANLTPSVAALLDPDMATGLQTLLLTSEPMPLSSLTKWAGKLNLLFAYGQSETVSLCCVNKNPEAGSDRKNVGNLVGRQGWLVDPDNHNRLVPMGAVGELIIQGPILARGYIDSEKTALVFLHGTTWLRKLQPGYSGRLYKTGDLAQFADDGSIRYIGRKDSSVTFLVPVFDLNHQSRIFQFASHAFDVAVSDYLFGLATGACICVPREADSRDNLASAMREYKANWTFLTPSVARTLCPSTVPDLRALVLGGESARAADFETWSGALRLLYVYGPAECSIYSTVQTVSQPSASPVNIGKGITATCWLTEPNNPERLVAIGAVGELVVEGPLVGRCYLGEEDLHTSPFIPYPKWLQTLRGCQSANKLYRTGDMVRYSPVGDGSLEEDILACVRAEVILTSTKYAATLATRGRIVFGLSDASLNNLSLQRTSESILVFPGLSSSAAYVFFTSGSTGKPKGVVVDHGALSTSCISHGSSMEFNEKTRTFQFTSYTFDISLMEIFTTLVYGGCVCVPSDGDRLNNFELSASNMKANTLSLTASVARLIEPGRIRSLETIIFVGENATDDDFKKWRHLPQIFDAYGPTECTIFCSINKVDLNSISSSVIGKAVGAVCWVVSPQDHCRLVPIGAVGELLVEGPVLAQGYLNDTERTSAAFVEDPPWLVQGITGHVGRQGRLYKTGDLVRYNEEGSLTYSGRKDTQIKIRGQRVELGDIECHMRDCIAGANQAVVMAISPNRRNAAPILTAFLCLDEESSSPERHSRTVPIPPSTKAVLADRLPAHMIPSIYIAVGRLPLNTSGKMDRNQLRSIFSRHFQGHGDSAVETQQMQKERHHYKQRGVKSQDSHPEAVASSLPIRSTFRDCSNGTESRIRLAWATILGIRSEMISVDDNFYDIGGDSIRIISLMRLVQNEFGIRLGQSLINSRNTTISIIADHIENNVDVGSAFDLEGEIGDTLSSTWAAATSQPWYSPINLVNAPATVFLTGSTGFLGTQILHCLLSLDTVKRVIALVRATSAAQGLERVKQAAVTAGWWRANHEARIEVWVGDLELSKLGLSLSQWARLSGTSTDENVTAIIHNGAVVNWHMDYDRLRSANVSATTELLKAATLSRSSPRFVFVSGGAIAELDTSPGNVLVAEQLNRSNGYSQSKFVAEAIIRRFVSRLPCSQNRFSVVKPGMIIGTADKGVANVDDFVWRVVSAASRLRLFPEDAEESWVPVSDAWFVASQTVAQIFSDKVCPYVNIASTFGLRSSDFWDQVNTELTHACEPVPWSVWVGHAFEDIDQSGEGHPLWPVQDVLRGRKSSAISILSPLSPPDTDVLCNAVRANVRYLGQVGFLEARQGNTL
ncbi:hypothetical protein LLEC1_03272 [Akanthomyces lecanii]|uniref:Carrier domain-containing protein n=1 Tax=Cordyceps confragosa TaxID=2714763 RepID=A0A179IKM0_CORDF|nr:hypothetical protein LLEC1_03272 [Akanthomyces lecanii]